MSSHITNFVKVLERMLAIVECFSLEWSPDPDSYYVVKEYASFLLRLPDPAKMSTTRLKICVIIIPNKGQTFT